jgi:hypothetical protein
MKLNVFRRHVYRNKLPLSSFSRIIKLVDIKNDEFYFEKVLIHKFHLSFIVFKRLSLLFLKLKNLKY